MVTSVIAGVAVIALVIGAVIVFGGNSSEAQRPRTQAVAERVSPLPEAELAKLRESTTYSTINSAPRDLEPSKPTSGAVVHPKRMTAVYAEPNGKPIAKIGPKQLGDTWLPVIDNRDGWTRVLLPSKPNGSSGWLLESELTRAVSRYQIRIQLQSMRLQLLRNGVEAGRWTIGIGKPETPTPVGRTFILGSIVDPDQQYSPVILPLGSHSATLDSFGGGPGTVAIHTWPTTDVLGVATSHGCVRVPKDALERLTEVPLGTLVLVDQN